MIAGFSAEQVARDNGDLAVYLRGLETAVSKVRILAGGGDAQSNTPATAPTIDPPDAATWTVSGQDGQFIIDITAPGEASPDTQTQATSTASVSSSGVLYQLQSATTLNFDTAGNVQTYGGDSGDPRTHYEIPDPNQTKYWRFRASFQNSDWGEWVYWIDPALCGVVAVSSGFLRSTSAAPNMSNNPRNNAMVNSVDAGADATIRVFGPSGVGNPWTRFDGQGGQKVIAAGTLTHFAYSTHYWVIYTDANGYQVYTDAQYATLVILDANLWAGDVTTVAAGGGGGTSGGGGSSGGAGGGGNLK